MQIISYYDDEGHETGFSFTGELEKDIEIAASLLEDSNFLYIKGDSVIFNTREGEVEYLITNHNIRLDLYEATFVEDRRG